MSEIILYLNMQAAIYCEQLGSINKKDCISKVVECTIDENIPYCFNVINAGDVLSE